MSRLTMDDERFAKDIPYLFMACQYVERTILESQINVSGQRGSRDSNDTVKKLGGAFSVFQKVTGSPKYWQHARSELNAKVKQLGPFHLFYTLSCAEMRWPEVLVSILRKKGYKFMHGKDARKWTGETEDIYINVEKDEEKEEQA